LIGQHASNHLAEPTARSRHQRHSIRFRHTNTPVKNLITGSNFKCT
jgi:hypothetical protein